MIGVYVIMSTSIDMIYHVVKVEVVKVEEHFDGCGRLNHVLKIKTRGELPSTGCAYFESLMKVTFEYFIQRQSV